MISETPEDSALMLVDSMKLAYEAFQGSRHICVQGALLLDLLSRTLARVRQNDAWVVQIPRSWAQDLDLDLLDSIKPDTKTDPAQVSDLPSDRQRMLSFVELSVAELSRLWPPDSISTVRSREEWQQRWPPCSMAAIQSLGYALHNLPQDIRSGREQFCDEDFALFLKESFLRIVALCWSDLSPVMQQALCELIGVEQSQAEELMTQDGFAVDMFGYFTETQKDGGP